MNQNTLKIILFSTVGIALLQVVIFYPRLPDNIAIHFNLFGEANNWGSKTIILILNPVIIAFNTGLFFVITKLPEWVGEEVFNIPNKYYWLEEDRKDETLDYFSKFCLQLGILTNLFLLLLFQYIYLINLSPEKTFLSNFWIFFLVYILLVTFFIYKFYKRFKDKPV